MHRRGGQTQADCGPRRQERWVEKRLRSGHRQVAERVADLAGMSETLSSKEEPLGECPVCYEKFHPLAAAQRTLSCGHTFCHDCLVKCLLSSRLDGQVQSMIVCPVCRYVTFLSKKATRWPPKPGEPPQPMELALSPSLLPHLTKSVPDNTLVVPSHFAMPVQSYDRSHSMCGIPTDAMGRPVGLAREAHVFMISEHGMPLVAESCRSLAAGHGDEASESVASMSSLGLRCCQSPIILAVLLISTVALLAAVFPWLLLVKRKA
nr:RING finger protein 222 [Pelodiscus sinensis]|eukprot:XP_006112649.2 RING finger protein 222 [Pelodiscus sinensis]